MRSSDFQRDFEDEKLLTPAQAAAIIGVDPKTVSRWATAGKIASTRTAGGHRRYKAVDVYAVRDGITVEEEATE